MAVYHPAVPFFKALTWNGTNVDHSSGMNMAENHAARNFTDSLFNIQILELL